MDWLRGATPVVSRDDWPISGEKHRLFVRSQGCVCVCQSWSQLAGRGTGVLPYTSAKGVFSYEYEGQWMKVRWKDRTVS